MSKYTTGELARLCNVSVRTVQYYDTRGILVPSGLSEGGRRLYSQADLDKMKIICFLRELELPIDSIKKLLEEEYPEKVIALLLDQQEQALRSEIARKQKRVDTLAELRKNLASLPKISVGSIGDIAYIMENKKRIWHLRIWMVVMGLLADAIQVSTLMAWIFTGIWWPFAVGMLAVIAICAGVSARYFRNTAYICPECHSIFKPKLKESFFAWHTPTTRCLTCPNCGHHGYCVETYGKETDIC